MRRINAYAVSVLTHTLKVDVDVERIEDRYRELVREVLGRRRIRWERLVGRVETGGFGVIDLCEQSKALKRTWLSYISEQQNRGVFEEVLRWWTDEVRERAETCVGPLMSWNSLEGYTTVWRTLCQAWEGIERWCRWNTEEAIYEWTTNDTRGEALAVKWEAEREMYEGVELDYRACDVVGEGEGDVQVMKSNLVCFKWSGERIDRGVKERKRWKELALKDSPCTSAQRRWAAQGFDWRRRWAECRRKNIPERVKAWTLDALNNAIRVCYHKGDAPCRLCGMEVNGRHYTGECRGIREMSALCIKEGMVVEEEEVWWMNWLVVCGVSKEKAIRRLLRLRKVSGERES